MKTKFTLLLLMFAFFGLNAQQLPNGGFENWTNNEPDGWGTIDQLLASFGETANMVSQDNSAGNYAEGLAAAKLTSTNSTAASRVLPAMLSAGAIIYGTVGGQPSILPVGRPYTARPDSITAVYKYTGLGNDTACLMHYSFTKNGTSIAGLGPNFVYFLDTTSQFLRFKEKINFSSADAPDTFNLYFYSGLPATTSAGSTMWVDDVRFIFDGTTSNADLLRVSTETSVFPSPASNFLNIRVSENMISNRYAIYDLNGRLVAQGVINAQTETKDVSAYAAGNYVLNVLDKDNRIAGQARFVVSK